MSIVAVGWDSHSSRNHFLRVLVSISSRHSVFLNALIISLANVLEAVHVVTSSSHSNTKVAVHLQTTFGFVCAAVPSTEGLYFFALKDVNALSYLRNR